MKQRLVTIRWRGTFPLPIDTLWRLLSDTDRINQALGLPPQTFGPAETAGGQPVMEAHGRYLGISAHWIELPFEWSIGRYFKSERVFSDTPFVDRIRTTNVFTPRTATETEVEVVVEIVPRGVAGWLGLHLFMGRVMVPRLVRVYERIVQNHLRDMENPYPNLPHSAVDERQLARVLERLRVAPVRPGLIDRLVTFVHDAEDREVVGTRPFVLADRWGVDRIEVLRLFLYATRASLFDLSWEVLCPNCRISKASFGTLSELTSQVHCETCNIEYGVDFDEYVEARFTINPGVREAAVFTFCLAGPANTRHIVGQMRVSPGQTRELPLQIDAGDYRLRMRRQPARGVLHVLGETGPAAGEVRWTGESFIPGEVCVGGGASALRATNAGEQESLLIVEKDAWGTQGASAALVTSLQEFRQLFSSEVLSPGMGVSVRNLTILFSDLKGSTRMYSDIGDSSAYARVRDHFVVLIEIIQRHRGALVKTIGDAVMAVFASAQDGIEAALDMLAGLEPLNQRYSNLPPLSIKLGLHRGPCLAINANDNLDYFGSTVNLAARVQGMSQGDDLVFTQVMMDDPGVRQTLESRGLEPEYFEATLSGYTEAFPLYRLTAKQGAAQETGLAAGRRAEQLPHGA